MTRTPCGPSSLASERVKVRTAPLAVAPAEGGSLCFQGAGGLGAAMAVHKNIAAGGEQVAGDGEADAVGASGDERAFAE